MQNETCTASGVVSDGDSEDKQRLVICAMDAKMKEFTNGKLHGNFGSAGAGPLATIMADPITCLICLPQYSIKAGNVTMTGRTVTDVNILPSATTRQITRLSSWQMAMSSFHALDVIDTPNYLGNVNSYSLVWGNAPFENLLRDTNPAVTDFATLYDANALTTASNKTFQRLTAQVALLNFMSLGNDTTVQVGYDIAEPGFCVASAIFYIMEILLGVLAIFSVRLAFLMRKHGIPPRKPFHLPRLECYYRHKVHKWHRYYEILVTSLRNF